MPMNAGSSSNAAWCGQNKSNGYVKSGSGKKKKRKEKGQMVKRRRFNTHSTAPATSTSVLTNNYFRWKEGSITAMVGAMARTMAAFHIVSSKVSSTSHRLHGVVRGRPGIKHSTQHHTPFSCQLTGTTRETLWHLWILRWE